MMIAMLAAGIVCLLAGLLAIGFGIPVNEFSFGNTLILAGAIFACAGLIMLSLWVAVRELKNIAERMGPGLAPDWTGIAARPAATDQVRSRLDDRMHGEPAEFAETAGHPSATPTALLPEEAAARDWPQEAAPSPEPPPAGKPRRNLMFSSTSRRERERARAGSTDPSASNLHPAPADAPSAAESSDVPPATFEDAWPKSERSRAADPPVQRRAGRAPSTFSEPAARPQAAGAEDHPAVTVIKSGVVDGMAYSLYSDGSIEAQMPEGTMRFASIDELRTHLDRRP